MPRQPRVPKYRHHKASGQAVVALNGGSAEPGHGGGQVQVGRSDRTRLAVAWYGGGRREVEVVSRQLPDPGGEGGVDWVGKGGVTFSAAITAVRRWLWAVRDGRS